ncbi:MULTISPECIES: FAD-binding oxidoreductase [Streptomyces]|uniref:FAD-binding oxidoreductase n=2 Tax=Streptomyces TaxID=1883 RepID=A0AB39NLB9_9ACTN|nr:MULTISPECIES: FAD-binding oxidoreductase [Streptomyces]MCI4143077.1 FAD-binding oxidoreductase [Streptomyces sp. MMS20-AI2-20]GGQ31626.1 FAD-linked oxidase [Streptomyces gancidicus]GGS76967.1 FAD-linked oxidase [Streptomyces rubiginosus]
MKRRSVLAGTAVAIAATALETGPAATAATAATGAAPDAVTILPGDPRYADLVVGNNSRWVARPDSVRLVRTTEQVVRAVQEAVDGNKRISVRSGGHCYADFVFNPEVRVVIDTSLLDTVGYDERLKAFEVGAGSTLLHAYESLFKGWGVTIPGGMCYSVGMGGHISGGGYGMLSRRHGLTVDHLYAVEVVVVDAKGKARSVVATREADDPNRDLWWAHTGGGGGNFGVVTRYWFRSPDATGTDPASLLPKPPEEVLVSALALPWSELNKVSFVSLVRKFGAWHEKNGSVGSSAASLCSFLMMNHRANGSIGLLTQIDATVPDAKKVLDDFLAEVTASLSDTAVRPMSDPVGELGALPDLFTPQALPWLHSVKLLGTSNPTLTNPTLRGHHKSAYLRRNVTEAQATAMYRHLTRTDHENPASMVVLLSYGGKINTVASGDTASVQRDSVFKGLFQSFWAGAENDAANIGWTRDVYGEVFSAGGGYPVPGVATDGCYINYPDADITDPKVNTSGVPWYTLYYKDNYPRLQRIKAAYDPRNIFRHSQSITHPDHT